MSNVLNPGRFEISRVADYGVLDREGKESIFLKFPTTDGEFTWFGSLKPLQPGKSKSAKEITFETLAKLGWDGDIDKFVNKMATFQIPEGTHIDVGDEEYAPGKISKGKVLSIFVPGFGGGQMDQGKAKSLLGGMKADIAKAQQATAMQKESPDF